MSEELGNEKDSANKGSDREIGLPEVEDVDNSQDGTKPIAGGEEEEAEEEAEEDYDDEYGAVSVHSARDKGPVLTVEPAELARKYGLRPDHPLIAPAYIERYRQLFLKFDMDGGGSIDVLELKEMLTAVGQNMSLEELQVLMDEFDEDGSGAIDFDEFIMIFLKILGGEEKDDDEYYDEEDDEKTDYDNPDAPKRPRRRKKKGDEVEISESDLQPTGPRLLRVPGKEFKFDAGYDWQKLHDHLDRTHPREDVEDSDDEGNEHLVNVTRKRKFSCCFSNLGQLAIGKDARELTPAELAIGPGLTIYFRQIKLFMMMYLVLSIFCVPQAYLYYIASASSLDPSQGMISYIRDTFMFRFTIGSLGMTDFYCQGLFLKDLKEYNGPGPELLKVATYDDEGKVVTPAVYGPDPVNKTDMHIRCKNGHIQRLLELGLSSWDSRCPSVTPDDSRRQEDLLDLLSIDEDCSYRNLDPKSREFLVIHQHFISMVGKKSEKFKLNLDTMFTQRCRDRIKRLHYMTENVPTFYWRPEIYIMVQCYEEKFYNPITQNHDVSRQYLLYLTVLTDCLCVLVYMIIIIFLEKSTERANAEFKEFDNELQIRDFAIQVSNLPPASEYKTDQILKALLFAHFERITTAEPQQIKVLARTQKYQNQIIDVNFGKLDYGPQMLLPDITRLHQRVAYLDVLSQNSGYNYDDDIMEVEAEIDRLKAEYVKAQNEFYESEQRVENLKNKIANTGDDNIQMAFVVFRSMEGRARALAAYASQERTMQKSLFNCICCICLCCCRGRSRSHNYDQIEDIDLSGKAELDPEDEERLKFMRKFDIKVEPASDPDHILWHDFRKTRCSHHWPNCGLLVFSLVVLGVLWFESYFKKDFAKLFPSYEPQDNRPEYPSKLPNMTLAYADHVNGTVRFTKANELIVERVGLVTQLCEYRMTVDGVKAEDIKFPGEETFCVTIAFHKFIADYLNVAISVLFALIIMLLFSWCKSCNRDCRSHRTLMKLQQSQIKTVVLSCVTAVIILPLLANLRVEPFVTFLNEYTVDATIITELTGVPLPLGGLYPLNLVKDYVPILVGDFNDANIGWYLKMSTIYQWTLAAFIIVTWLARCLKHCCRGCRMCCDRCACCCCCRFPFGTCQRSQHDLQRLYSGTEFDIATSYQMVHLVTWFAMTFSTTMPLMYGMAFVFFFLTFSYDKYLVLNYHQRPRTFNEEMPTQQVWLFKWPIFLHVAFSVIALSSNQMFFEAKLQSEHIGLNRVDLNSVPVLGDVLQDKNKVQEIATEYGVVSRTLIPTPQSWRERFLSLHMMFVYTFWILVVIAYILQEQVENCLAAVCAKCRGDGEYDDYDSEAEEAEIRHEETSCAKCENDMNERRARREQVKKMIGSTFRDNNQLDKIKPVKSEVDVEAAFKKSGKSRFADSSEEEQVAAVGSANKSDNEDDEVGGLGHYSDDFLKEVSIDYLFYYYDMNNYELQRTIQALTMGQNFNTQYNQAAVTRGCCATCLCCFFYYSFCCCCCAPCCGRDCNAMCCWNQNRVPSTYVGTSFRQAHMKRLVGLYKRRRRTFKRRFIQIMKKLNPRVKTYLSFSNFGLSVAKVKKGSQELVDRTPFDEQLRILRRILLKRDQFYDKEAPDEACQALSINSWAQKRTLNALVNKGKIKQETQSYGILDQQDYQGAMALLKLYLDANEIKSNMTVVINRSKNVDAVGCDDTSEEDYVEEPEPVEQETEEEVEGLMGPRLDVAADLAKVKKQSPPKPDEKQNKSKDEENEESVRHEFEDTGTNLLKPKEHEPSMSLELTDLNNKELR